VGNVAYFAPEINQAVRGSAIEPELARAAGRVVVTRVEDPEEAREVLRMLGIAP
jgi:hypothetical protein